MSVIRLLLAYDGTHFHGWARQPGLRTIQGVMEDALGRLLPDRPRLSVAGRTDAGVHAEGQVASFPAFAHLDPGRVQRALNGMLAPEIAIRNVRRAPDGFDARRSATGRCYRYLIDTDRVPDPFTARFVWHRPVELSLGRMRAAARLLVGEHDFASLCRSRNLPGSTVRDLRRLSVAKRGHLVTLTVEANAFLHQMVRSLAGTLVAVGMGKMEPEAMPEILGARHRSAAGPVAPPHGLTLMAVSYAPGAPPPSE